MCSLHSRKEPNYCHKLLSSNSRKRQKVLRSKLNDFSVGKRSPLTRSSQIQLLSCFCCHLHVIKSRMEEFCTSFLHWTYVALDLLIQLFMHIFMFQFSTRNSVCDCKTKQISCNFKSCKTVLFKRKNMFKVMSCMKFWFSPKWNASMKRRKFRRRLSCFCEHCVVTSLS